MFKNKKGKFKWLIAGEVVSEFLEAGLSLITLSLGVMYFQVKSSYFDVFGLIFKKAGIGGASAESTAMFEQIGNSFPFNYLYHFNPETAITLGLIIAFVGLVLTILTTKTFKEFVKEIGKGLMIPGVIGLVSVIILTVASASSMQYLATQSELSSTAEVVAISGTGLMTWQMMGVLFMIGIYTLLCGLIIQYVVKTLGAKRHLILYLLGQSLFAIGIFSIGYYFLIRILGLQFLAETLYGANLIKYFLMSWYISKNSFIISLLFFFIGRAIYKVGTKMPRTPVAEHWLLDYFKDNHPPRRPAHPHYTHPHLKPVHPYQHSNYPYTYQRKRK